MRHLTLVEQIATYDDGTETFTLTDAVPGRLTWAAGAAAEGGQHFYRAANANESNWEIGVGNFDGSTGLERVSILASSTGDPVVFIDEVTVALIAPAGALWAVAANGANRSALANGVLAMAAGSQAEAHGNSAVAVGFNARAGSSGTPADYALALGAYADADHASSVALGEGSSTLIAEAVHHRSAFWWSSRNGYTEGAETSFLRSGAADSEPSIDEGAQVALKALVVARNFDEDRFYAAEISAMVRRNSGGVATVLGTPTVTEIYKTPGAAISATIAGTGTLGHFGIEITGETGEDWYWGGELRGVWV